MASNLVQIDYELFSPRILTIEDAIIHQSYFGDEICHRKGDINKSFLNADYLLEGELFLAGQEHFYMETNACIVIPSNDENEITLYLPIENPTVIQKLVALVLGTDVARIRCHTKRIGEPFGGKESKV
jgi:xanthine dehydrogenase molybdopterin-binding subunit B